MTTAANVSESSIGSTTLAKNQMSKHDKNGESIPFKESWNQWRHSGNQVEAEKNVLNLLNLVRHPKPGVKTTVRNIPIQVSKKIVKSRKPLYLHEFAVEPESFKQGSSNTLVIMHGYAAGLGFFFKNFDGLHAGLSDWNIYALDWLGFGLSARPKFHAKTSDLSQTKDKGELNLDNDVNPLMAVRETEDWFIESLEAWRKTKNIEKFTLMGHSMGGYLSAVYAFRYPQHVEKLIMVSPAGVERGHNPNLDNRSFLTMLKSNKKKRELTHLKEKVVTAEKMEMSEDAKAAAEIKAEIINKREMNKLMIYLWNHHLSPFSFLRTTAAFGPKLMSTWSNFRFKQFPEEERLAMHIYCYKTFIAAPSGEYGLTRILAPGAIARMPLLDRVSSQLKCPSIWIYGDRDWMDGKAGVELVETLNKTGNAQQKASFHIVKNAGHHVYLDNHQAFNSLVLEFLGHPI